VAMMPLLVKDAKEGLAVHGAASGGVGDARPGVDEDLSVEVGGDLQAAFEVAGDQVVEHSLYAGVDVGHDAPLRGTGQTVA